MEIARTKGQAHLKAISLRRVLSEALTDVLVAAATRTWCIHRQQSGRRLSEGAFRSRRPAPNATTILPACIGLRPDLPRHHYLKLIAKASLTYAGSWRPRIRSSPTKYRAWSRKRPSGSAPPP